jgi:hypothetical protein
MFTNECRADQDRREVHVLALADGRRAVGGEKGT